jgi:hypothetical protein
MVALIIDADTDRSLERCTFIPLSETLRSVATKASSSMFGSLHGLLAKAQQDRCQEKG